MRHGPRSYFHQPIRDHDWRSTERENVTRDIEHRLQIALRMEREKIEAEPNNTEQKAA